MLLRFLIICSWVISFLITFLFYIFDYYYLDYKDKQYIKKEKLSYNNNLSSIVNKENKAIKYRISTNYNCKQKISLDNNNDRYILRTVYITYTELYNLMNNTIFSIFVYYNSNLIENKLLIINDEKNENILNLYLKKRLYINQRFGYVTGLNFIKIKKRSLSELEEIISRIDYEINYTLKRIYKIRGHLYRVKIINNSKINLIKNFNKVYDEKISVCLKFMNNYLKKSGIECNLYNIQHIFRNSDTDFRFSIREDLFNDITKISRYIDSFSHIIKNMSKKDIRDFLIKYVRQT